MAGAGHGNAGTGAARRQATPIARALNAVSARSGRPLTMRTKPGRFRIQKVVYLLRHIGYAPARKFEFNIYMMGPYSPELARAYYLLEDDGIRAAGEATDISPEKLALVSEMSLMPLDFLEGITTILDVRLVSDSLPSAFEHARAIKPNVTETTWRGVRTFLQSHPNLVPAT